MVVDDDEAHFILSSSSSFHPNTHSGGVAAHVYTRKVDVGLDSSSDRLLSFPSDMGPKHLVENISKRGQAFCFLPLPVDSGLPVFVNGYFELSSNRRDIWAGGGE